MEAYKKEFIEFMVDCQRSQIWRFCYKERKKNSFLRKHRFLQNRRSAPPSRSVLCRGCQQHSSVLILMFFSDLHTRAFRFLLPQLSQSVKNTAQDIRYCSNRKEVKDHGDKGILLGSPINDGDRVVIIEDVTTAGTSIEETLPIIKAQGDVNPIGLVVSVDRMERGKGTKSALSEIEEKYGLKTTAIVTMAEVVEHLYNKEYKGKVIIDDKLKAAIDAYYEQYGVKE